MDNNKNLRSSGMGVGYVSLMILFVVICLTVLGVLSFQAASSNDILNKKSTTFTHEYYAADSSAKRTLAELDGAALAAHDTGFFEDSFLMYCEENDKLTAARVPGGISVSWNETINSSLTLSVKTVFLGMPTNGRYRIECWQSIANDLIYEDEDLGVWDGSFN